MEKYNGGNVLRATVIQYCISGSKAKTTSGNNKRVRIVGSDGRRLVSLQCKMVAPSENVDSPAQQYKP